MTRNTHSEFISVYYFVTACSFVYVHELKSLEEIKWIVSENVPDVTG